MRFAICLPTRLGKGDDKDIALPLKFVGVVVFQRADHNLLAQFERPIRPMIPNGRYHHIPSRKSQGR